MTENMDGDGFAPLSQALPPEVRALATTLRRLLKGAGKSQRQFAVYHHISVSTVSRYLSGERIPDKHFLDALMKSVCKAHDTEVSAELQGDLYRLHREALLAKDPPRYREQMASDRLEDAVLRQEDLELELRDLRVSADEQLRELTALESQLRMLETSAVRERGAGRAEVERHRMRREELENSCALLREEVARLEAALRAAERERDTARERCRVLEDELAEAQEASEKAELEREAREERVKLARAAEVAEHRLADLERVHREAERVIADADREAALQVEGARAQVQRLLDEAAQQAAQQAATVRPQVLKRSAALRQLRLRASELADHTLPGLYARLAGQTPWTVDTSLPSIGIQGQDDVALAAGALDRAYAAAAREAARQALARGSLETLTADLTRRCLTLVARQLEQLEVLEKEATASGEEARTAALFDLDLLVTRTRRACENMLIMVSGVPGRRFAEPVPLRSVLRAAASEVEGYDRVDIAHVPEVEVAGRFVADLTHALAEFVENAVVFSPPHTRVVVTGVRLPDGRVMLEIDDAGLGIPAEAMREINARLAEPAGDLAVLPDDPRLGIFIVSRLTARIGVRAQVRPSDRRGTTALVMLPDTVLAGRGHAPRQDYLDAFGAPHDTEPAPHLFTICDGGRLTIGEGD
ncbi:ATP-binding protein [Streptomyces sp. NPDC001941]|uniref:ATP-binding protein n=1 Tax=Streptomyces sp. NPDC001941 TaxID=3154659 RepID=UPI00331EC13C